MMSSILLVEDDRGIATVVADLLKADGHQVEVQADGEKGLRRAVETTFDLLILDVMLPGMNGFHICRTLREEGFDGPILMLTARGEVSDRVEGLRKGADDYLIKPFAPAELVARAEALLRRVHKRDLTPVRSFRFGKVSVDFGKSECVRGGKPVSLAAKEIDLLRFLIHKRGQILTREAILSQVWKEQKFITARTVDVHIAWLRQKLEENPEAPKFIQTVRGAGYRFAS